MGRVVEGIVGGGDGDCSGSICDDNDSDSGEYAVGTSRVSSDCCRRMIDIGV